MGWLTRSRAPSDDHAVEVGRPTLQFTDAQPRHDLQALGQVTPVARPPTSSGQPATQDEERPKTAGAASRQKPRPVLPATPASFNLYPSAATHGNSSKTNLAHFPDEGTSIGMALGSPTHPPPRSAQQGYNRSPLLNSEALAHDENLYDDSANKNKSGKWKKIGGLFKAKNAFGQQHQHHPSPFYSLSNQYAASVSPTQEFKSAPSETWPLPQPPPGLTPKAQKIIGTTENENQSSSSLSRPSVDSNQKNRSNAKLANPKRSLESHDDHNAALRNFERSNMFNKGAALTLPSLDVEIPDAQMERYSIMFGSLLGGSSSNLLARRSRMLEKLKTLSDEEEPVPPKRDEKDLPLDMTGLPKGPKDHSHLAPHPQLRRATSPSSPNFTAFPKNHGLGKDGRRSPAPRSNTAPARLSPMQETFEHEQQNGKGHSQADMDFVSSPSQTNSATTHSQKYSSDSSFLSPATTRNSAEEEDILFHVKPLQPWNEHDEEQWVLGSNENLTNTIPATAPLKPRANLGPKSPEWEMIKPQHGQVREAEVRPLRIQSQDSHEETLAALERPAPKGQDIAPLGATRAAVDRLMSPPPFANQQSRKDRIESLAPDQAAFSVTSDAVSDAVRKLNEPLTRTMSQKRSQDSRIDEPAIPRADSVTVKEPYVPKLKVRNRSNTITQSEVQPRPQPSLSSTPTTTSSTKPLPAPHSSSPPRSQPQHPRRVASRPAMTDEAITTLASDLDALEHQIESRAVRAMKKQAFSSVKPTLSHRPHHDPEPPTSPPTSLSNFPIPSTTIPPTISSTTGSPRPPLRSATEDPNSKRTESRAVRAARKQAAELSKAKSLENLHPSPSPSPSPSRSPSPLPHNNPHEQPDRPSPAPELQLARQISLSNRPKQLLVPISKKSSPVQTNPTILSDWERIREGGMRVGTPTIVEPEEDEEDWRRRGRGIGGRDRGEYGRGRGHRVERSVAGVVESA
ncbi:MAG: hypothetical protein Q9227_007876 [Pyrenula ochraceoflavens]